MSKTVGIVILAAGKGTRMKSDVSKPMVSCLDRRLIDFPMAAALKFLSQDAVSGEITLVTGYKREGLESYIGKKYSNENVSFAHQKEQLGTAHALSTYFTENKKAESFDYTLVLCADTPLIKETDLSKLLDQVTQGKLDGAVATFDLEEPTGYGRIHRFNKGFKIIEEKDASDSEKKIREVNSALYLLNTKFTLAHLSKIDSNNKSGEFYLTDLFKENSNVLPIKFQDYSAFLGVNNLEQLENMEKVIRLRKIESLSDNGVRFIDRNSVYIDEDVEIGHGCTIYPNVYIETGSVIESNVRIEHGTLIRNSIIKKGSIVKANSYIDQAILGEDVSVGPFAHLRPGSDIGAHSKIGNFVEIKKSKLEEGVKISHLSYVGDAEIGKNTNIGCGFITCNYDGANKHLTKIGEGCFIGSDSQMIAPIEIGNGCYVASGSTINQSMSDGSFAIARAKQSTKEGLAKKFIKKKD